jgi:hydroxymethylbilane synthase
LNRLGKRESIRQVLPATLMCPAAGQGAMALEIRKDDSGVRRHIVFLDDDGARRTTTCERALLNQMGGGCQVPIGALAEIVNGRLHLEAVVARPDGTKVLRESGDGDNPVKLGEMVGETLLRGGGDAILREVYGQAVATPQQP